MAKLRVSRFNISKNLKLGSTCLIIGRRGSGKSTLLRDIAYHLHKLPGRGIDLAIGMSPTEGSTQGMSNFLLPSMIYNSYREDVLERIMETQRKSWARGSGREIAIFLDDIGFDKTIFNSKVLRELFMNGRHRHITLVLCVQYSKTLGPSLRSNCDIVISCRDNIVRSRRDLHEHFYGVFESPQDFDRAFLALTQNYSVLICVNNGKPTGVITDCIFHYKAALNIPPFALCNRRMLALHNRYYDASRREQLSSVASASVQVPISCRKIVRAGPDGMTMRSLR